MIDSAEAQPQPQPNEGKKYPIVNIVRENSIEKSISPIEFGSFNMHKLIYENEAESTINIDSK